MPLSSFYYTLPYQFLFLFLFTFSFKISNSKNRIVNLKFDVIRIQSVFYVLFIFIGLRGFIYTDWSIYYPFYEKCPNLFDGINTLHDFFYDGPYSYWEKGFVIYSIILKTFSSSYVFFQTVSWLIDFFVLHYFFKTYIPKYEILGFCFYIVFGGIINLGFSINFLRNAKSLCLFLISIRYLETRKIIPYMLLNTIGIFFHSSSILYLPLYFILNKKFPKMLVIILFAIGNVIYLLQIRWCSTIISTFTESIGGRIGGITAKYIANKKWSSGYGISVGYLERTFTFFLAIFFWDKLYRTHSFFMNSLFFYLFAYLYLSEMSILTDRIPLLFVYSYWSFYPLVYGILSKGKKYLYIFVFLFYSIAKIFMGQRSILCLYDNYLLGLKYSYLERISMKSMYFNSLR